MKEQTFGQQVPKSELETAKLEIELLKMQLKQSHDNAMLAGKFASQYATELSFQIRKQAKEIEMLRSAFECWLRKYWENEKLSTSVVEESIKEITDRKYSEIADAVKDVK